MSAASIFHREPPHRFGAAIRLQKSASNKWLAAYKTRHIANNEKSREHAHVREYIMKASGYAVRYDCRNALPLRCF